MKKFTLLFALLVSMVLLSSSCEKEEMVTPTETGITAEQLKGQWNFVSLEIDGHKYTTEPAPTSDELQVCSSGYDMAALNLNFTSITNVNPTNNCELGWSFNFEYTLSNNILDILVRDNKFEIINAATFNGTVLKLKLIDQGTDTTLPLNGTYTLTK